ncbi:MAG: hypothetical protein IKX36_11170 [Prevotella sp.]|nr:hypothetical protein [Prevotella sp.]
MKKKNQKRNDTLKQKSAIESFTFQTSWGLKNLYGESGEKYCELAKSEVGDIIGLGLVQDILSIKGLVDGVRSAFHVEPCAERGDFCNSLVTIALGIAQRIDQENLGHTVVWNELMKKKLLKIFYPETVRNMVFEWAKANGYNTSTYLGRPMIKFDKLFILLDRA